MRVVDRSPLHVRLLGRAGASEIMLRYEITPHAMEVDITINPVENGAGVFVWCVAPCDPVEDVSASEFAWRFAGVHRGHLRMKHMERSGVRIAGGMIACRIEGRSASARLELVTEGKA
jgi:hypothetical protein